MKILNDEFVRELRARALSELAGDIEMAAPAQGIAKLSASLYNLMLQVVDMCEDDLDVMDGIETAMAEFDHDLSDRLDLKNYSVVANTVDKDRPVITIDIKYKNVVLTTFSSDLPTLKLMAWKRKIQTSK